MPEGLGSQVQTWRYQIPSFSARFSFCPMIVGGSSRVHAEIGTRYSDTIQLERAVRHSLVYQHLGLLDLECRIEVEKPEVLVYERMPDGTFKRCRCLDRVSAVDATSRRRWDRS